MLRGAEVFRCVFVLRIVAAAYMAAGSAEAKMHPRVAAGEALLAARGIRAVRQYEVEVRTFVLSRTNRIRARPSRLHLP